MSWRTALAGLTVAAALVTGCGGDADDRTEMADLELYDFDGDPTVVRHDSRPIVLNFFAESCPPCVAEMPAFDAVYQSVADRVDFVGVSEDATAAAGQRIVAATGITYPTVWDADGTAIETFEGLGLPTTVFVAADGEVVDVHTGALSESQLADRVTELLDVG